MLRPVRLMTVVAVLIATGILAGRWRQGGAEAPEYRAAAVRLAEIPITLGDWQGEALDSTPLANVTSSLTRRYYNRRSDRTVSLLLVCGRPGPVSVHPPEVCYSGAGYEQAAAPVKCSGVPGGKSSFGEFWTTRFQKPSPIAPERLRIYWAWNANGTWAASTNPRLEFAGNSRLYKLYVISEILPGDEKREHDACLEFMQTLLPELKKCLFPV